MPAEIAIMKDRPNSGTKSLRMLGVIAVMLLASASPAPAQDSNNSGAEGGHHRGIGFSASKDASAQDVRLPWYPGARRSKGTPNNDTPSVQFSFWSGSSAFQLVVLKLESGDPPEKVQAFYRNALARYGRVVTCAGSSSAASQGKEGASKTNNSDQLDCESDKPETNETVLKAGTKHNQHLVGVTASGSGSVFQLVYLRTPKSDQ